jgi:hypothetical protein
MLELKNISFDVHEEGEEKEIHTVGIIQGNGHVDYILTVDGCYPREAVSSVRITCRIPSETP